MSKHSLFRQIVSIAVFLFLSGNASGIMATEGAAFWVNKYAKENSGEGRCCAGCDDLPTADNVADGFLDGLAHINPLSDRMEFYNKGVDPADIADDDRISYGNDKSTSYGIDWAEIGLYAGHGGCVNSDADDGCPSNDNRDYSYFVMGESHSGQTCYQKTNDRAGAGTLGHIYFGDGGWNEEMKAFLAFSCQSGQLSVFHDNGYSPMDGSHFRIYNAFHGCTYTTSSSSARSKMYNYVDDAELNNIGDAWIDRWHRNDGSSDRCPVSIVWGSSRSVRDDFFENGGIEDWKSVGSHVATTYYYIDNCNPKCGPTL